MSVDDGFAAMAELERAFHQGKPFDLVIVDQMMPGLSGEALAQRIRATRGSRRDQDRHRLVGRTARPGGRHARDHRCGADQAGPRAIAARRLRAAVRLCRARGARNRSAGRRCRPPDSVGRSLRILLAEDNKINQQLVTMLLRKADHQVDVVENGELAVEAVRSADYDVVLMDVQMPVLDGVQATKRIRALPPPKNAVPIIALTAHAMAGAKEEYLAAEMDDYLSKPIDNGELFSRLNEVSRRASSASARQGLPSAAAQPVADRRNRSRPPRDDRGGHGGGERCGRVPRRVSRQHGRAHRPDSRDFSIAVTSMRQGGRRTPCSGPPGISERCG